VINHLTTVIFKDGIGISVNSKTAMQRNIQKYRHAQSNN
jgi:hypothetical protein